MAGNIAEVVLRVKADASQVPGVARALQDVSQDAERAAASLDEVGDSAGHVGQNSAKLAGALDLVAPGLGQVALGLADIADVGEVAAAVASALGVSLGTLAAAALPIAAIVAAVALAWEAHTEAAKESEEAMKAAARTAEGTAKAMEGLGRVVRDNLTQQRELSGEYTAVQAEAIRAGASIADSYLPALQAQTHELELSNQRLAEYVATRGQRSLLENTYADKTQELTAEVEKQRGEVTRLNTAYKDALVSQDANIKATGKAKEEQKAATTATKAHTEAIKEQTTYSPSAAAFEGAADERIKYWEDIAAAQEEAGARREAAFIADTEQTQAWAAAQDAAFQNARKAAEDYQNAVASGISSATSTLSSVGGAITSGSLAGVIGAIGPALGQAIAGPIGEAIGGAVGAWFGFLEQLGSKSVDEIKASMSSSMDSIIRGIYMLPELIGEVFQSGGFFRAYEKAITLAFARAVVELWQAIIQPIQRAFAAIREFFENPTGRRSKDERQEDRQGRREQRRENVDGLLKYLWSGEFATGTDYVPRTGLALVHQGERIETARGGGGGMGARTSASGGDVHLHLSGFAVGTADQLIRELNKHLGAGNRRLSWSG